MSVSSPRDIKAASVAPETSAGPVPPSAPEAPATPGSPPKPTDERRPRIEQRRERQRREARRAILDATEVLMIEKNGSDFSIRSLGERSGYSAPTVYHYFGDKDGLIEALLEERVARLADEFERIEPTGDPRSDLRAMLLAYYEFSAEHQTFTRLMWTLSRKGESRMPEAMNRVRGCIDHALERFGGSGQLGAFDADSAGRILWALAYGLVSLRITQPELTWDDRLVERALDALFLGMTEMENASR
jgi:AcrR family transcriptional regulator